MSVSEGQPSDVALWKNVLSQIESKISRASFVTWFRNTEYKSSNDAGNQAIIYVPNIFTKQQLEIKYNELITNNLSELCGTTPQLTYKIKSPDRKNAKSAVNDAAKDDQKPVKKARKNQALNTKYTFDNFIVGSGNELAHAAGQSIAAKPGEKYNPLFIYGGVGLGKTHLIQAIGNGILENNPDAKIVYVSTETFVNEFLESIRFKKQGFADRYRNADVLIVDDIQFIAGKEKTQEEFFHTFNALHQSNKQIIITSDKPPKAIPTLEERLRSRFEWGMSIDIQPPDLETREAILQTKASQHDLNLPPDVVEYIAQKVQTNIRELEGSLNQLIAYCELRDIDPSIDIAKELVANRSSRPKSITPKIITERISQHFDIPIQEITGSKRDKSIVLSRQIAMYFLRNELNLSFPKIARELGRKDHTTAIHSVAKIEKMMDDDYVIRQHVQEIRSVLHG